MIEIIIGCSILISAIIVLLDAAMLYCNRVIKPVAKEHMPLAAAEWKQFIVANFHLVAAIKSCVRAEHCYACADLIRRLNAKYRMIIHTEIVERTVDRLWEMLNDKYKAIEMQFEPGELTIDDLIN